MRLLRTSSRAFGFGRDALDQRVERALGVQHQRPQLARASSMPEGLEALRRDEVRLVAELGRGRAQSASRRAGSIVTTATRWPRAAMPAAIAADGGRLADAARSRRR